MLYEVITASYIMDGSEKYVNSGWLIPKAYVNEVPGSSETFTVTFEKTGTFVITSYSIHYTKLYD